MNKFLILLFGVVLGIVGFIFTIHSFHNLHVIAVFDELEPFPKNLNVYYKGFKLGRSLRVYPSKDFTQTNIDLLLNAKGISLPDNITVKVRNRNKRDYIELIYPDTPSVTYLKNHARIKGEKTLNISAFLENQADNGGFDEISDSLNDTVGFAGSTFEALTDLIHTANDILIDLRPSLKQTGDNLAITSKNLADLTTELNNSANSRRLQNTFSNIELITRNLEETTSNTTIITKRADKETIVLTNLVMKNLNIVVQNLNCMILNLNDIVKGFKSTLSKQFGTMRVMFGKPINNK